MCTFIERWCFATNALVVDRARYFNHKEACYLRNSAENRKVDYFGVTIIVCIKFMQTEYV